MSEDPSLERRRQNPWLGLLASGIPFPSSSLALRRSLERVSLDPTRLALSLPRAPLADAFFNKPLSAHRRDAPLRRIAAYSTLQAFSITPRTKNVNSRTVRLSVRLKKKKVCLKNSTVGKELVALFGEEAWKYRYRNSRDNASNLIFIRHRVQRCT